MSSSISSSDPRTPITPEHVLPATPRRVLITLGFSLLLATLVNYAFTRIPTNRGYWIFEHKWRLLQQSSDAIDLLFVGDSSCNQSVIPGRFRSVGLRGLNLCTIGSSLVLNDLWMIEAWLASRRAPDRIVLIRSFDVWDRPDTVLREHLVPRLPRRAPTPVPQLASSAADRLRARLVKALPLWFEASSIRQAVTAAGRDPFATDSDGFMAVRRHDVAHVEADLRQGFEYVRSRAPQLSPVNRTALSRLAAVTHRHGIKLDIVSAPVGRDLAETDEFRRFHRALGELLGEVVRGYPNVRVLYSRVASYANEELEGRDHILESAAVKHSDWLLDELDLR
jgi:hypothetical protein